MIVTVAESTLRSVVVPLTTTVSAPSASSSLVGTRLKVALPFIALALIVRSKLVTVAKSVPAVALPLLPTDTSTTVFVVSAAPSSVPVTVTCVDPSPSSTVAGSTDRITFVGVASSSVIVTVAASTSRPVALPLTVTVSDPSATSSSVGSRSKVAVPSVASASMSSVKLPTAVKSVPDVAVPSPTVTVTDVAAVNAAPSSVPVTVMRVALSPSENRAPVHRQSHLRRRRVVLTDIDRDVGGGHSGVAAARHRVVEPDLRVRHGVVVLVRAHPHRLRREPVAGGEGQPGLVHRHVARRPAHRHRHVACRLRVQLDRVALVRTPPSRSTTSGSPSRLPCRCR